MTPAGSVMTTLAGKSGFPENHRLALGTGAASRTLMVHRFMQETDFVLGIGTSFTQTVFNTPMPKGIPLAQVTSAMTSLVIFEALLTKVLTYHVVSGKVMSDQAAKLTSAKTVQGKELKITASGGSVMIDNAKVVKADIACSNGVIHVIDTVVLLQ